MYFREQKSASTLSDEQRFIKQEKKNPIFISTIPANYDTKFLTITMYKNERQQYDS